MTSKCSWIVAAGGLAALFVAPAVNGHVFVAETRQ